MLLSFSLTSSDWLPLQVFHYVLTFLLLKWLFTHSWLKNGGTVLSQPDINMYVEATWAFYRPRPTKTNEKIPRETVERVWKDYEESNKVFGVHTSLSRISHGLLHYKAGSRDALPIPFPHSYLCTHTHTHTHTGQLLYPRYLPVAARVMTTKVLSSRRPHSSAARPMRNENEVE